MEKPKAIDLLDSDQTQTFLPTKLVDPIDKLATHELNIAHQRISTWLHLQLNSVLSFLQKLESMRLSPEFSGALISVRQAMRQQGDKLVSLIRSISTDEQLASCCCDIIRELDDLTNLLINFIPRLAPIQSYSDPRLSRQNLTLSRFRWLIRSSEIRDTMRVMTETQNNFKSTTTALGLLHESIKLTAALQRARLAEKDSLEQKVDSIKKKLAYYEATQNSLHVPSKEPRSKMTLKIAVDGRHMYPGIHQRPSPFRDSASSNKSRHEHFHNEWLKALAIGSLAVPSSGIDGSLETAWRRKSFTAGARRA
ncbi:hypothetical protein GGS24DRAFT_505847 [Hypoxylon argillaceum]|nr:hypothetical protein GGS24DRAFT_505847 [Hypoxylon argillaceum]